MNLKFKNDKILINELQKGNKRAYDFLFETYYAPLCVYSSSLTNDTDLAEDIVQNTIVKIWEKRNRINIHTSLKSYLYKSVYHDFINEHHKNKKRNEILDKIKLDSLNNSIEKSDDDLKLKLALLDQAIDQLPKKCKKVFVLNKKEGYSYEEISEILNISMNTVENHISNALKKIRKQLLDNHQGKSNNLTSTELFTLFLIKNIVLTELLS